MHVTIPGLGSLLRRASRKGARTINLLIAGARRSGTTSLEYYLQEHPAIGYFSGRAMDAIGGIDKGLPYNAPFTAVSEAPETADAYARACARIPKRATYIAWRSVYAMHYPHVIYNLFEHLSDLKILFSLRDPVDTFYSVYCRQLERGTAKSLEETLQFRSGSAGSGRRPRWAHHYRSPQDVPDMVARGIYLPAMRMFMSLFGPERIHVYPFPQMVRDPEGTMGNILRFLQLDETYRFKRAGEVRSRSKKPGPMPDDLRERLHDFYAPFNEALFELLNWPPDAWD